MIVETEPHFLLKDRISKAKSHTLNLILRDESKALHHQRQDLPR